MKIKTKVSTVMSKEFPSLLHKDSLDKARKIFEDQDIPNIPIFKEDKFVGILSKVDFLFYTRGEVYYNTDTVLKKGELKKIPIKQIMNKGLPTLHPKDSIKDALEIFEKKRYQCLPVLDNTKLVGLLTPLDISKVLI